MKLILISNRLPVKTHRKEGGFRFSLSEGGLATGLNSLQLPVERHWIGWPEAYASAESDKTDIETYLAPYRFHPVFLTPRQVHDFYEGYSNSVLWPLCHYFYTYIHYDTVYWHTYKRVNEIFCREALRHIDDDDIVWVHDYQLMLLPGLLRKACPHLRIGYFHHIPFPSYELFRVLPERAELLEGLLGADLVGFHTPDYMRHFISSLDHVLGLASGDGDVYLDDRVVRVDAFPMGINYTKFHEAPREAPVQRKIRKLKQQFGNRKLVLSVDRLDYSKGILHRLKGFGSFLENHPEYRERVSLAMIIVPSRDKVDTYALLRKNINEAVSHINGTYASIDWTPVVYFYHGFSFEELSALYHLAHVALVTPLRDGMNLVAKEYVAAKRNTAGVLILSEMAGAAMEMKEALIVNPNDPCEIEEALYQALEMPEKEQTDRLRRMQRMLSARSVDRWANDFIDELDAVFHLNDSLHNKQIGEANLAVIRQAYRQAKKRLLIFDYDGTLVPFTERPQDAVPSARVYALLERLAADPANTVAISSGRDRVTLEKWFGGLPVALAAEHGAFYKENGCWYNNLPEKPWDDELIRAIREVVRRTPGSSMEIKRTAVVWHYRGVNPWLAAMRENELYRKLEGVCSRLDLQLMKGNKIVEIKSPAYTKGSEARRLMASGDFDFILAVGDDVTDEEMFRALPPEAATVKVGDFSGSARFNLQNQSDVLPFLELLVAEKKTEAVRAHEASLVAG